MGYRAAAARAMTEAELREHVRRVAAVWGWRMHWTWRSDRSPAGWPDLVLAHPDRGVLLFRELKREHTGPTARQRDWLDALTACGQDAGVWRPTDLLTGAITRELSPGWAAASRR